MNERLRLPALLLVTFTATALADPPVLDELDPGPSCTLNAAPPAGAVVLFDGKDFSRWQRRDGKASTWQVGDDGSVLVHGGDAISAETFGDFQLHLEFLLPAMPEQEGQARANSGVYLHGQYEVQVLDSFGSEPAMNSCGAIYSISPPMTNASRPPEQWQTYDIIFRAPRFDGSGKVTHNAFVTVLHNGLVILNNLELPHTTPGGIDREPAARGPLLLQDHGDPVRYRNIWVRPLG